jgi:hypothetical protein
MVLGGLALNKIGGDFWDDFSGKTDAKSAAKANKKNVKANLAEIEALKGLIASYFTQAQGQLQAGYARGREAIGGYLDTGAASYDQALAAIQEGFAGAQEALTAQAGAAQSSALASQQQALAAAQQGLMSRGLGNTSVGGSLARGIAADTARALGQTMAGIGAQRAQVAQQQGAASAGVLQNKAGFMGQAAGMTGALETGEGQDLARLLQGLAGSQLDIGALKANARNQVQHVAGPSDLQSFAQIGGMLGNFFGG